MLKYSKALVIGGWSEDHAFLAGLTREITDGPHKIAHKVRSVTLAEALKNKEALASEAKNCLVITHSAGMMAIQTAAAIVVCNGVEPTPLPKVIAGGIRVAFSRSVAPDSHAVKTGLRNGLLEVLCHPSTLAVLLNARHFSTVRTLIDRAAAFPGGRVYLPSAGDEFGFGSRDEVAMARRHGIAARMLPGRHNECLLRPREGARHIKRALAELV